VVEEISDEEYDRREAATEAAGLPSEALMRSLATMWALYPGGTDAYRRRVEGMFDRVIADYARRS